MQKVLISIIITVYNTKPYLEKCLDSVLSQNSDELEIIIVNDGSTDDSLDFCRNYTKGIRNVIIIDKENGGASDARNAGLKAAQGDYIHFIDSDDFLIYDSLYKEVAAIVKECSPDIIFSLDKEFTTGDYVEYGRMPLYETSGYFKGNVLLDVLKHEYVMTLTCPVNKLFNRTFLLKNDLTFTVGLDHEEDEWLPRVISCAKDAYYFNEFIYGVRVGRPDSLSNTMTEEVIARKSRSKMIIADNGMDYMKARKIDEETLRYIAGHYWEYMMGAVINTQKLKDKKLKNENFVYIKNKKKFFKNYKLLRNKNWRLMGWMFVHLGIKFTAKILAKRYAKQYTNTEN